MKGEQMLKRKRMPKREQAPVVAETNGDATQAALAPGATIDSVAAVHLQADTVVLVSWYEYGSRLAAARVAAVRKYKPKRKADSMTADLVLTLYPPNGISQVLKLHAGGRHLIGPGEREHELRYPNTKEAATVECLVAKEAELRSALQAGRAGKPRRSIPEAFRPKAHPERIIVLKKDNPYSGNRGKIHGVIVNGMTVDQWKDAVRKLGFGPAFCHLQRAIDQGLIKLEKAKGER